MAKKTTKKSNGFFARLGKVKHIKLIVFVLVFALLGGSYYVYKSSAGKKEPIASPEICVWHGEAKLGSRGPCVRMLKFGLNGLHYYNYIEMGWMYPISVGGDPKWTELFDVKTRDSVKLLQRRHHITEDAPGVVGGKTWQKFFEDCEHLKRNTGKDFCRIYK